MAGILSVSPEAMHAFIGQVGEHPLSQGGGAW